MLDENLELINAIQPMDATPSVVAQNLDLMVRIRDTLINILQWTTVVPNSQGAVHTMPTLPVRINDMLINHLIKQFPAAQQMSHQATVSPMMVPQHARAGGGFPNAFSLVGGGQHIAFSPHTTSLISPTTMLVSPNTAHSLFSPSAVLNLTPLSATMPPTHMFPSPSPGAAGFVTPTSMLNLSPLVTTVNPHFLTPK